MDDAKLHTEAGAKFLKDRIEKYWHSAEDNRGSVYGPYLRVWVTRLDRFSKSWVVCSNMLNGYPPTPEVTIAYNLEREVANKKNFNKHGGHWAIL